MGRLHSRSSGAAQPGPPPAEESRDKGSVLHPLTQTASEQQSEKVSFNMSKLIMMQGAHVGEAIWHTRA